MTSRAVVRATRLATLASGLVIGSLAAPAFADTPETWETPSNGSALDAILLLGGATFAGIAIIALLTYLPSMIRKEQPGSALAFQENPEWFGGPRTGTAAAATATPATPTDKGGASGSW